ncbi:hypothetical protein [Thermogemmatispora sp.]|uniref:hypothetical protein n=1 Tax=Thermogemmatispora sp. TaxID=1968838 RepID=UPI001DAFE298|nr:hypothetical protein [Thermogemmatispora sp.]MBX5449373.1 hypothetical protein [Thermogemmatispora sp.]
MQLCWFRSAADLAGPGGQHPDLALVELAATDTLEAIIAGLPTAAPALLVQFPETGPLVEEQELLLRRCQASAERLAVLLPPEQRCRWGASAYRAGVPFACMRERALALLGIDALAFPRDEAGQQQERSVPARAQPVLTEHQPQPEGVRPRLL